MITMRTSGLWYVSLRKYQDCNSGWDISPLCRQTGREGMRVFLRPSDTWTLWMQPEAVAPFSWTPCSRSCGEGLRVYSAACCVGKGWTDLGFVVREDSVWSLVQETRPVGLLSKMR